MLKKRYLCINLRAEKVVCEASLLLHDNVRMAALSTNNLIAKGAVHSFVRI